MNKRLIHIDYVTESGNAFRGNIFDKADYDALSHSLVVWKDNRSYILENIVSLTMCGEVINE